MAIKRYKYQTDAGTIVRIRMDEAKAGILNNTEPAGALDDPNVYAIVSDKGRRRKQSLAPRGCTFTRTGTLTQLNKVFTVFIPTFTPAAQAAVAAQASITYKGNSYDFASTIGEA